MYTVYFHGHTLISIKSLISYEGEQIKFKLAYREIQEPGPAGKPNQFTLKIPQMTEVYITDSSTKKEIALATVNEFRRKILKNDQADQTLELLQVKAHTEEVKKIIIIASLCFVFLIFKK